MTLKKNPAALFQCGNKAVTQTKDVLVLRNNSHVKIRPELASGRQSILVYLDEPLVDTTKPHLIVPDVP
jgi:hypothetical protein